MLNRWLYVLKPDEHPGLSREESSLSCSLHSACL
jgi:hypothetical protein